MFKIGDKVTVTMGDGTIYTVVEVLVPAWGGEPAYGLTVDFESTITREGNVLELATWHVG